MRTLVRNQTPFSYALFVKSEPIIDEYGNETSEQRLIYGEPVSAKANISAAKGETETMSFGESLDYDRVLVMKNTEINEFSALWLERPPTMPHDYVVVRVARSLNSVAIAVKKVDVR